MHTRDLPERRSDIRAYARNGTPVDYEAMTIEHIAPENPVGGGSALPNVGKLGNLILLPEAVNSKLGNAEFAAKRTAFKGAGVPLDSVLETSNSWSIAEINRRTEDLAKRAHERVFRV